VAPIALFPDPLIATVLPASAYPLEVVQAARFVKDTNNISKLDTQKWDDNVKAVARFPEVIAQMNDNIQWTSDLGDAFINEPKGVTDAIQRMRAKAQGSGALKTSEQQIVTVTNTVATNIVEEKTVIITNQVVQIQPSSPSVVYVPQYNPTVVYGSYPVAYPGYVYPPYYPVAGAAISFGVGMAAGAIMANNCDWGHGGSYHGDVDVNRDVNRNVNRNVNRTETANVNRSQGGQKWQPDQNRLKNSGSTMSSAQNREARGYGSGSTRTPSSTTPRSSSPSTRSASTTPATRPSTTTPRASAGGAGSGSATASGSRQSAPSASARQGASSAGTAQGTSSASRPSSSGGSAFSGGGGAAQTRSSSARGSASRGGGGGGGARGGGGGRR
jgi:Protein of unknown function (DUF3300)